MARRAWQEAYDLLAGAEAAGETFGADDLAALGEAAFWMSRHEECMAARQKAYAAYLADGRTREAAFIAMELVTNHYLRLGYAVAGGWFNNAKRLLENEPDCPELGQLVLTEGHLMAMMNDFDGAIVRARAGLEIGRRYGSVDLQALAMTLEGYALAQKGRAAEGVSLLDEAMVNAQSGRLGPLATGIVYCRTVRTSMDLFDYRRASDWTQAIQQSAEAHGFGAFPGDCRAARAALLIVHGDWVKGEQEAHEACAETGRFDLNITALSTYAIGEIRRRCGDHAAAEAAFYRAHELGFVPQPGLALLRLAQGKIETAAIAGALAEAEGNRLKRAQLLPAQAEIAVAAGDLATARAAVEELGQIAFDYGTPALRATSECAWGQVLLAAGDASGALKSLREGCKLWLEVEAPYEAARARLAMAGAHRALGDPSAATLEARAALSQFERLGAAPDARRAAALLEKTETA
jgi:tetratricopeptide (TPR) repeat protein